MIYCDISLGPIRIERAYLYTELLEPGALHNLLLLTSRHHWSRKKNSSIHCMVTTTLALIVVGRLLHRIIA